MGVSVLVDVCQDWDLVPPKCKQPFHFIVFVCFGDYRRGTVRLESHRECWVENHEYGYTRERNSRPPWT